MNCKLLSAAHECVGTINEHWNSNGQPCKVEGAKSKQTYLCFTPETISSASTHLTMPTSVSILIDKQHELSSPLI